MTTTSFAARLRRLPAWVLPAVAAALAALLTLAIAVPYYLGVARQWEERAEALQVERDAAAAERDDAVAEAERSAAEVEIVVRDRDKYRDSVEAAEVRADEAEAAIADLERRESELAAAEEAVADREAAVTATEQRIADTTIREGTWIVGVDVEPGTYRTANEVAGFCYWSINRIGVTGLGSIIDNDIVTGGRPMVVLQADTEFETNDCGSWVKQ